MNGFSGWGVYKAPPPYPAAHDLPQPLLQQPQAQEPPAQQPQAASSLSQSDFPLLTAQVSPTRSPRHEGTLNGSKLNGSFLVP